MSQRYFDFSQYELLRVCWESMICNLSCPRWYWVRTQNHCHWIIIPVPAKTQVVWPNSLVLVITNVFNIMQWNCSTLKDLLFSLEVSGFSRFIKVQCMFWNSDSQSNFPIPLFPLALTSVLSPFSFLDLFEQFPSHLRTSEWCHLR